MSYNSPSVDVVTIDGGTNIIAAGAISIELNLANRSSVSGTDFTMDVIKLGGIEYDYNYIESVGDVNDFKINVPRFEMTILDELSSGVNFIDFLNELYPFDLIVAKVTLDGGTDYYYCTRDQCEFSYLNRSVKFDMQAPLKYQALAFGKSYPESSFPTFSVRSGGQDINAVTPRDFLFTYLQSISNDSSPTVVSDTFDILSTSSGFQPNDKEFFFNQDASTWSAATDFEEATGIVKQLALRDAAIVGSFFGVAYFIPRSHKETSPLGIASQLTKDSFEKLELDIKYRDIRDYFFSMNFSINTSQLLVNETINDIGRNDITVTYNDDVPYLAVANYNQNLSPSNFEILSTLTTDVDPSLIVDTTTLTNTFKKIFRVPEDVNNPPGSAISGTVLGIDNLKAFQYIVIPSDAGIHPLVDGRDFRPSYLKYDLVKDTVEFEAYEF